MAFTRSDVLPLLGKEVVVEMFSPTRCFSIPGVLQQRRLSYCEFQVGDEETGIVVFEPAGIHTMGEAFNKPNITLKGSA